MVVTCEINFDQNAYGTYFAGQVVSGTITFTTDKTKIVKGIMLKVRGYARTRWNESDRSNSDRRVVFQGSEDYLATSTYLLGSQDSQTVEIQAGTHAFAFACPLPSHCPSSFEGETGYIRYTIKGVLARPWKFDQTFTRGFTVIKFLDLNYESPIIRIPAVQVINKTFCCGPCSSQPLNVNVSVPQTGFVPGQNIKITVLVQNESNVSITDLKISLVLFAVFFSQYPRVNSRTQRKNLVKLRAGPVNVLSTREFTESIQVPAAPPTCLTSCRILQVSYQVEVEVKLKRWQKNPIISIPITVGSLPLQHVIQHQPTQFNGASTSKNMDNTLQDEGMYIISNGNIPPRNDQTEHPLNASTPGEYPPPSYQEAVFMTKADCNEEDQHPLAKSDFVPRYPVYNISEPDDKPLTTIDLNKSTWL